MTSSCMYLRKHFYTMRCRPSHTAIWTYRFEVDILWGRIPMPPLTLDKQANSKLSHLMSRGSWCHCQSMTWRPRIHRNLQHTSMTLAMRYQTSQSTLMTFPKWRGTALFELPLAKNLGMP